MHHLLRPSLYGAFHAIMNLTRHGEPMAITADVVGPICETGDVLGIVYARSRDRGVGFAVSTTEIRPVLDSITDSRADTGRCI